MKGDAQRSQNHEEVQEVNGLGAPRSVSRGSRYVYCKEDEMTKVRYDGIRVRLVDANGIEKNVGDTGVDFRGEYSVLSGAEPPLHEGSTGRVYTTQGCFFPSVYRLKWEAAKEEVERLYLETVWVQNGREPGSWIEGV